MLELDVEAQVYSGVVLTRLNCCQIQLHRPLRYVRRLSRSKYQLARIDIRVQTRRGVSRVRSRSLRRAFADLVPQMSPAFFFARLRNYMHAKDLLLLSMHLRELVSASEKVPVQWHAFRKRGSAELLTD